ncbi:MAG: sulfatase [Prolixibacteraceae bacterium]
MLLKSFLTGILICTAFISGWGNKTGNQSSLDKPNILFILTDDQGYPTLGCYGGEIVPTPNLDKLAEGGALFTDAYVTSQCTPTRATLLTGQYTARNRMWHVISWYGYPYARMTEAGFKENLDRSAFTIAKGLRAAGYTTGIFGKWHLTSNNDGNYRGLNPDAAHYYGFDFAPPLLSDEEFEEGADRGVLTLTRQALRFIEDNKDEPWFCLLSHHMIHGKVVAPEELQQKYREKGYTGKDWNKPVYLAGLEQIDISVGKIMEGLKKSGELQNTIVIFMSDNGGIDTRLNFRALPVPNPEKPKLEPDMKEYDNAPLRAGKGSAYEGGVRVPFIVNWPGTIDENLKINAPVHAVDIAPTLFAVAGAESEAPLDGENLLPLLNGKNMDYFENRPVFQYFPFYDLLWGLTPCATIRKGDYKLIEFFGDRFNAEDQYVTGHQIELYNLKKDIGETTNLAEEESELAQELLTELHDWMERMNAPVSIRNPHFNPDSAFVSTREKPYWIKQRDGN